MPGSWIPDSRLDPGEAGDVFIAVMMGIAFTI
jgi:hypothetical protein